MMLSLRGMNEVINEAISVTLAILYIQSSSETPEIAALPMVARNDIKIVKNKKHNKMEI